MHFISPLRVRLSPLVALSTVFFALTSALANTCLTDTSQADFQAGTATQVDLNTSPGDVLLLDALAVNQQNTTLGTSGVGITTTTYGGQTFTPSVTGKLARVSINLFCSGCTGTTPNLTLSLRATSGGLPTGADLASTTVAGFSSGSSNDYIANFASPYTVSSGTQYAIVIHPTTNPSPGTYALTRSGTAIAGSDVYSGGTRVAGATGGTVWSIPLTGGVSTDAGFKIYLDTGFPSNGNLVSSSKNSTPGAGYSPTWTTLSWTSVSPANTQVQFQVGASNSPSGPFNFVGPDGTSGTTYTTSGASLSQFNGLQYLQYKALLSSSDTAATPTLNDVTTCYSNVLIPVVTALTPSSGPPSGGGSVTVTGTGLSGASQVAFGATPAGNFTVDSDTQITATAPAGTAGTVDVTVTTLGGTSSINASDQYTYVALPTVVSISPSAGPLSGGGTVTLTGANFAIGATTVTIGGNVCSSPNVTASTSMTCATPAGTAGAASVVVTTSAGSNLPNSLYTYLAPPSVAAISPSAGPLAGGSTVTLSGSNFVPGGTTVTVGGNPCTSLSVASTSSASCTLPAGTAGPANVMASTAGGSNPANSLFTYLTLPVVTTVSPAGGTIGGGTTVTLTGSGFSNATSVKFGSLSATSFVVNSPTQITAVSPASTAGSVDITVTTAGGTSTISAADQFTYSVRQTGTINAASGGGSITAQITSGSAGCSIDLPNTIAFTPPSYGGLPPTLGGLKIKLSGCNSSETVTLAVSFSNLNGMTAKKYGPTPSSNGASVWYTPTGLSISGNTITYDVTDNGLGDDTFTGADGIINDPIVPVPGNTDATSVPTMGELSTALLTLAMMGTFGVRQIRRQRRR